MPSLFKLLLIEAIQKWLLANEEIPTQKRIQQILQIEIPAPYLDYLKDIEDSCHQIEKLIISA